MIFFNITIIQNLHEVGEVISIIINYKIKNPESECYSIHMISTNFDRQVMENHKIEFF